MWRYILTGVAVVLVAAAYLTHYLRNRRDDTSARYLATLPPPVPHEGATEEYADVLHTPPAEDPLDPDWRPLVWAPPAMFADLVATRGAPAASLVGEETGRIVIDRIRRRGGNHG